MTQLRSKISLTIDPLILDAFREYCNLNGYKMSTRIEVLIVQDMEDSGLLKKGTLLTNI
jgi:hypothetical protein